MELYCINSRCFLKNVKTLTADKICKACGKIMFPPFEKEMIERTPFAYPNELYEQFEKWKKVKPKVSQAFLEESVILFHYHILFIGRYLIMRYMQQINRITHANELLNYALNKGSLENWMEWISFCYENRSPLFDLDNLDFLAYLFDKNEYPKKWVDDENELRNETISFGELMPRVVKHILQDNKIVGKHIFTLIIGLNDFFREIRLFEKGRFYHFHEESNWVEFKKTMEIKSNELERAVQLNFGHLTLAKLNHSLRFCVLQPIHFSPFSIYERPWLYMGKAKSSTTRFKTQPMEKEDVDPLIKKKMKVVSQSTFQKLSSASRNKFNEDQEQLEMNINGFVVPERYKHLKFLDTFNLEKNQFLCDVLDLLGDNSTKRIALSELFDTMEQKKYEYDWKSGFFSALGGNDLIWYSSLQNDEMIMVELNPSYLY